MIGNEIKLPLIMAYFALLLFFSDTLVNGIEAAAISEEAKNRGKGATVRIYAKDYSWEDYVFSGSGFFVAPDIIATNFHVIEDEDESRVKSILAYKHSKKDRFHPVRSIRGFDRKYDLAILEVARSKVKPLSLGASETVESLDKVYVFGYPIGLETSITPGVINNPTQLYDGVEYLHFDAAVSPGNSGGPVLNTCGDVIGVATRGSWIIAQNLNFAVPSNHLRVLSKRQGVRLLPKPRRKPDNRDAKRRSEEKAKTAAEIAKAEAEKAEAEAKKAEADARRVEAEAKKVEAEARKVEAEAESAKREKDKSVTPTAQINKQLEAAIVRIIGQDPDGKDSSLGIGFFVRPDQVATDFHVIDGSKLIEVKRVGQGTHSSDTPFDAQLLKTDKAHHLAILQVKGADVQPLRLANSEAVAVGEEISIVGDPSRGEFSTGKISKILNEPGVRYFEFDALVLPGSSGGPILNSRGEVIAVVGLKVPELSGTLKFAIPSNYLEELLTGPGDPPPAPYPDPKVPPRPVESQESTQPSSYLPERLLQTGIERYEKSQFPDAIEHLESALNGLHEPVMRAKVHLYLGFSKWGLAETESSVNADFREALRYNPDVKLPPRIGQNHPVFKPLLELARRESLGTLTVSTSPPETEIWLFGGEMKRRLLGAGTASIRLFKGNYAIEGVLEGAHKVVPVLIKPGDHEEITLVLETEAPPSHEFELTLDIFSTEKPKKVVVHYTIYDASGNQIGTDEKKEMRLQKHNPESSIWVYHVKLPSTAHGDRIVYRIEADGKVIRAEPIQIHILEPPISALFGVKDTIPVKARVESAVAVNEVRVYYDAPRKLSKNSPSKLLKRESESNTYTGEIPAGRNHADTWLFVVAVPEKGIQSRSPTRAVRAKPPEPPTLKITLESVPDPLPINKPINITAEVKSGSPLQEVRVYYDFPRKQLSESSPYATLENKSSDTYVGKIPKERTREEGYIWFFVMATTEKGLKSQSEDSVIEIKEPTTRMHQGVWASHSWSNLVSDDGFYSGWERGDVLSLAFMREGRGIQTLGAQLDYTYENPDYISAMVQWGPSTRENPVAFAFLAGVTGYRTSDPSFSRVRRPRQLTPILGGSMKFFPLDRVTVDLTASMKLRSEVREANGESDLADDFLHHYEMGIRLYISPSLNFKAGYGMWRLGGYDNTSVRVGLGATF